MIVRSIDDPVHSRRHQSSKLDTSKLWIIFLHVISHRLKTVSIQSTEVNVVYEKLWILYFTSSKIILPLDHLRVFLN